MTKLVNKVELHLGRNVSERAVKLKMINYVDKAAILPKIPDVFGHETIIPATAWGMLGNDKLGDCVCAGAYHEHMMMNSVQKTAFDITDDNVIKLYEAVGKYNPKVPSSDQGTDPEAAAAYRRKTGILDKHGKRHKIDAYVELTPGDVDEYRIACYLFGMVGVCVQFKDYMMDQFNAGQPWDYKTKGKDEGGHYIPGFADRGNLEIVTWGRLQGFTKKGYSHLSDQALAYVSKEYMDAKGVSPEGFAYADLMNDLASVTKKAA